MLDIKLVREEPQKLRSALKDRGADLDIESIIAADARRRELLAAIEEKRADRNAASEKVGQLMRQVGEAKKAGRPAESLVAEVAGLKDRSAGLGGEIAALEEELRPVEDALRDQWLLVPNLPHDSVPKGVDERDNSTVRTW